MVKRLLVCCSVTVLVTQLAPRAAADEGMWLFEAPPTTALKQAHNFEPSVAWLEHLQKSCVRIGASGAFVSPDGLLMTNHHVGSDQLEKLSTPDRDLIKLGFTVRTRAEEVKCPDLEIQVLWSTDDVTQKVNAAVTADLSPAAAFAARRKRMTELEAESRAATSLDSEIVTLYHGARYHLYRYRSYKDVRLVFAPEFQIAFFGGDNDNFEYPRFCLDVCFFRVYENDQPLKVEHYLKWSRAGASDGELVFVAGHPGRTNRLYTAEHLQFLRDVELPFSLQRLWRREVQLLTFVNRSDESARIGGGDLFGAQNSRKARTGALAALQDPQVVERKAQTERELAARVHEKPERMRTFGDAWDSLAAALSAPRERFMRHELLGSRGISGGSELFRIARHLVRLAKELPKPSAERLREYRDTELDSLYHDLYSPAPIYDELELDRLASGLSFAAEMLGGDDPLVRKSLGGRSPRERAAELVRGTRLKDVAARKSLAAPGAAGGSVLDDAMMRFAAEVDGDALELRKWYEDEFEGVERVAYAKIAAAQFARGGAAVPPDATGTLRLSFGTVRGYREDGRDVPPFTEIAGLYERSRQRRGTYPFNLPPAWADAEKKLALETPFNFVCTADIIGGNSGSPVVNRAGEVVGLIFDGNIQSLAWGTVYTDEQARAVAVDSRAITEALQKVYNAGALANELTGR